MGNLKWVKMVEREADFWKNYMMISSVDQVRRVFGCTIKKRLTTRRGMTFVHWLNPSDVWQCSTQIEDKLKTQTNFITKLNSIFDTTQRRLITFVNRLSKIELKKLSDRQLLFLYNRFCQVYRDLYAPFHLTIYTDSVENKVKLWLKRALKQIGKINEFDEYLIQLTTPSRLSLLQEEERSLLSFVLRVKKERLTHTVIDKLLTKHVNKFAGLTVVNDDSKPWSRQYFIKRFNKLILQSISVIQSKYKKLVDCSVIIKKQQDKIFEELAIPVSIKKYFLFIQDATWIRLTSRNTFALAHYLSTPLFIEIGRRRGLHIHDIKWLTPDEVKVLLINHKYINLATLAARIRVSVLLFHKGRFMVFEGRKAEDIMRRELGKAVFSARVGALLGTVAYPGKINGRAKIIFSQKDIVKMKKGNILVARMTTPDIILAIRKAAAIVTDEGGITCHAAIVSRELRIPCVVGTKFATKIIKDNDIVEVDANKGIVKKIKL